LTAAPADRDWPATRHGIYATIALTLAYVLSFVDRQILTLLVGPIQADLGISDTQMSLLIGAAFALFYAGFGMPIGWLVDRYSRRRIAASGIAIWSVMTALCGIAGSYGHLFLARMGVGLGEATLTPASFSLLADSFAPARLVRAIGVYMSGAIIGIALAYALGGQLAGYVAEHDRIAVPVLGTIRGWQAPFLILLVPGLVVALLVAAIKEPPRRQPKADPAPVASFMPFVRARARVLGPLFVAMGAQSVIVYANLSWMPTLLGRRFGWAPADIGLALGAVFLTAGLSGNLLGALIGGRLLGEKRHRAYMGLCIASTATLLVVGPLGPLAGSPGMVLAFLVPTIMLTSLPTAIVPTAVQMTTPGPLRGQTSALYLFCTQLLGLMFGPTLVALFTDYVFVDQAAIGQSQSATVGLAAAISLVAFLLAAAPFSRLAASLDAQE